MAQRDIFDVTRPFSPSPPKIILEAYNPPLRLYIVTYYGVPFSKSGPANPPPGRINSVGPSSPPLFDKLKCNEIPLHRGHHPGSSRLNPSQPQGAPSTRRQTHGGMGLARR